MRPSDTHCRSIDGIHNGIGKRPPLDKRYGKRSIKAVTCPGGINSLAGKPRKLQCAVTCEKKRPLAPQCDDGFLNPHLPKSEAESPLVIGIGACQNAGFQRIKHPLRNCRKIS